MANPIVEPLLNQTQETTSKLQKPVLSGSDALTPDSTTGVHTAKERSGRDRQRLNKLASLMDEQRIYLDPALTIDKLADRVGVSERTLSTLINKQLGENFQNFVNGNRVLAAKAYLSDPAYQKHSVLDVMYRSGFNSKATFNKYFKQLEGTTPSQYRSKAIKAAHLARKE